MSSKLAQLAAKHRAASENASLSSSASSSPSTMNAHTPQISKLASLAATPRSSEPRSAALSNLSARLKKAQETPVECPMETETPIEKAPIPKTLPTLSHDEKLALLALKRQRPQIIESSLPSLIVNESAIESYFIASTSDYLVSPGTSINYKIHKSSKSSKLSSAKLLRLRFRQATYLPYAHPSTLHEIGSNFSKPSPDDIVLAAQARAFEENKAATSSEKRNYVPSTLDQNVSSSSLLSSSLSSTPASTPNTSRINLPASSSSNGGAGGVVAGVQNRLASMKLGNTTATSSSAPKSALERLRARKEKIAS